MPIYEYACQACGHEFETLVRSTDVPHCPSCESTTLAKKLSAFATASGSHAAAELPPNPCASCGNPGGPGSCAFH